MTLQQWAGVLIIAGFVLVIGSSLVFPGTYYMAETEAERQAIWETHQGGWIATNWLWIAASAVTAGGLTLLAVSHRETLSLIGAGVFGLGTVNWLIYLYRRLLDSGMTYAGPGLEVLFVWLAAGALILFGIAFLRGDFPNWVGYVHLAFGGLFLIGMVFFPSQMYSSFPPQAIYLVVLMTGIAAMRPV